MTPDFTLLDHTADIGMKVSANDLDALFIEAARALVQLLVKGDPYGRVSKRNISIEGADLPDLMVRWLGEILYLFEGERLIATAFPDLTVGPHELVAAVNAFPYDPGRHEVLTEIKGITYHESRVLYRDGQWEATIILDI
jgi:SHS2 domain-containing protein